MCRGSSCKSSRERDGEGAEAAACLYLSQSNQSAGEGVQEGRGVNRRLAKTGAGGEEGSAGPALRPDTALLQHTFYISKLVILTASNLLIQED